MAKIRIETERCKGCQLCLSVCPQKNLVLATKANAHGFIPVTVVEGECSGCGLCFLMCPDVCISIQKND